MNARHSANVTAIETAASAWIVRRDAGLTLEEAADLERWRAADPRHAAALAAHESAWTKLDRPRQAGAAAFMRREYDARQHRRRQRRLRTTAAAGIFALLAGAWTWQHQTARVTEGPITAASTVVVSPTERTLPDGTRVELRSGAVMEIAFEPGIRRVQLTQGEAHFDVVKDPSRPFVVRAGGVEIRAVGTAFSVQLGAAAVAVIVTEGQVGIEPTLPTTSDPAPLLLEAGKRVLLPVAAGADSAPTVTDISVSEMDEQLAWRKTHLDFADTPLSEAVVLMNRHSASYAQTRLALGDTAVGAVRVSGYFRADSVDAFVRLIAASAGIEASHTGNTTTLRLAR